MVFSLTNDTKLRWFQTRINHRILGTNYLLRKMNISDNDLCSFCHNESETLVHLFYECQIIKRFWKETQNLVKDKCNIVFQEWTKSDILFGSQYFDSVINKIILYGKFHIYYCKMNKARPDTKNLKTQIKINYTTEKISAHKNKTETKFQNTWEKFKSLVE